MKDARRPWALSAHWMHCSEPRESPAPSCRLAAEKSQHPCHCTQLYLSPKVLQVKHKLLLRDTSQLVLHLAPEPRSRLNSTGTTMSLVSLSLTPPLGSCENFPQNQRWIPRPANGTAATRTQNCRGHEQPHGKGSTRCRQNHQRITMPHSQNRHPWGQEPALLRDPQPSPCG